jgi:hypothetical protein
VKQTLFNKGKEEIVDISCTVVIRCETAGTYGHQEALLYSMSVSDTHISGGMYDNADDGINEEGSERVVQNFDDMMSGWFKFVQTEDGSVPAVFHNNGDDSGIINFKKAISAAFQANFKGTSRKVEADPQSLHVAEYMYEDSAQDKMDGVIKMHRRVTSEDVKDYASHIPGGDVALDREEDIVYRKGVLTHSEGVSTVKMMPQDDSTNTDNVEGDSLEAELGSRRKREDIMSDFSEFVSDGMEDQNSFNSNEDEVEGYTMAEEPTYDETVDIDYFEASGSYSLDLIRQRRVLRHERSAAVNHLELPEAMESTLMAHIDLTAEDMYQMKKLRIELGDVHSVLATIHKDLVTSASLEKKVEELLTLEAKYGPISGYEPAINDVIKYLSKLIGSTNEQDRGMRIRLYFMLSIEGSVQSQMALLSALDSAIDEEEQRCIVTYIAFATNPQPQMISELENRIGNDTHSTDPLLLAYGALVAKASPDLQQRMTLFLLSRLPQAETNSSSLIHHILSLGNTESHQVTSSLTDYLQHPDHHVQLSSIYALRYATSDSLVQKALTTLLSQSQVSDEHLATVLRCLLFGIEHASNTHTQTPFNIDLATALSSSVMKTKNEELQQALIKYLHLVNNPESMNLVRIMTTQQSKGYLNDTRLRRGSDWDENNACYDLVSPLATRQEDVRCYPFHKAYIWCKTFGVPKGSLKVAAGAFVGASLTGDYKVFARVTAIACAFGSCKTIIDYQILREKKDRNALTKRYVEIIGKTLLQLNNNSLSALCDSFSNTLYESSKFTVFNFQYSVFIYAGYLTFRVTGYVSLNIVLNLEYCLDTSSVNAAAGLATTITLELRAEASATLLEVVRVGISVSAIFNYRLTPELSIAVCYTNSPITINNCVGIYHEWPDNRIVIDTWYQTRSLDWCRGSWGISYPCFVWGSRHNWDALSTSWSLGAIPRTTLWSNYDAGIDCIPTPQSAVVGLESTSYQVSEDVPVVEVCITVYRPLVYCSHPYIPCPINFFFDVTISSSTSNDCSSADGNAGYGSAVNSLDEHLIFAPCEWKMCVNISTVDKGNESFNVTLERTPDLHSNITLDPAVGVVEITELEDDDLVS